MGSEVLKGKTEDYRVSNIRENYQRRKKRNGSRMLDGGEGEEYERSLTPKKNREKGGGASKVRSGIKMPGRT